MMFCAFFRIGGNVLDRIYWSEWLLYIEINNVPELGCVDPLGDQMLEYENFGSLRVDYKEEYLQNNCEIKLVFPAEGEYIKVRMHITVSESVGINLESTYEYDSTLLTWEKMQVVSKEEGQKYHHYVEDSEIEKYLTENGISKEDIRRYQEYMLYDVAVRTWVNANGGNYEREVEKLKRCKTVDNTFQYEECIGR